MSKLNLFLRLLHISQFGCIFLKYAFFFLFNSKANLMIPCSKLFFMVLSWFYGSQHIQKQTQNAIKLSFYMFFEFIFVIIFSKKITHMEGVLIKLEVGHIKIENNDCQNERKEKYEVNSGEIETESNIVKEEKLQYFLDFEDSHQKQLIINCTLKEKLKWKAEEIAIVKNQYAKLGPNWTQISKFIRPKTAQDIKNWFGNSLRKNVKKLQEESRRLKHKWQRINKSYILRLLQVIQQAERYISQMSLTLNQECNMIKFKNLALNFFFDFQEPLEEDIHQAIRVSCILGEKMKCLGVFKVKNRSLWKLSFQSFLYLLDSDNIVMETKQKVIRMKIGSHVKVQELNEGPIFLI